MKKFLIIIVLSLQVIMQANNTDSLKSKLDLSIGKDRISILVELMESLKRDKPKQSITYGKEALDLLKKYPAKKNRDSGFIFDGMGVRYDE